MEPNPVIGFRIEYSSVSRQVSLGNKTLDKRNSTRENRDIAYTGQTTPTRQPWHAGLQPMHWRILTASFMGWIFDGFESFALFLVPPLMLKSLLMPN